METDRIIRDWLGKKKIYNNSVIDMYIDSCDMGNDPDGFIKFLEGDSYRKENDSWYCEDED